MQLAINLSRIIFISLILICSSAGNNFGATTHHFNSLSFKIDTHVSSNNKFTIFNLKNPTKLHITFFTTKCINYIFLFKVIDGANVDPWILPEKFETGLSSAGVVEFTYSLDNGEYNLVLSTGNPEMSCNDPNSEVTILGNTGQPGIDPCEHLFLYPTQATVSNHANQSEFMVVSPPNCHWTTGSNNKWITINHDNSDAGSSIVKYSVSQNVTEKLREGTMSIWNKVFHIEQDKHRNYLPFIPLLTSKSNN